MDFAQNLKISDSHILAYKSFFFIENILRIGLHNVLVKEVGEKYNIQDIFPPFSDPKCSKELIDINKHINSRISNDSTLENYQSFYLLDYSIFISLLNEYWDIYSSKIFIKTFRGEKNLIIGRLNHIKSIRNDIAHNRVVAQSQSRELVTCAQLLVDSISPEILTQANLLISKEKNESIILFISSLDRVKNRIEDFQIITRKYMDEIDDLYNVLFVQLNRKEVTLLQTHYENFLDHRKEYNSIPRKVDAIRNGKRKGIDRNLNKIVFDFMNMLKEMI